MLMNKWNCVVKSTLTHYNCKGIHIHSLDGFITILNFECTTCSWLPVWLKCAINILLSVLCMVKVSNEVKELWRGGRQRKNHTLSCLEWSRKNGNGNCDDDDDLIFLSFEQYFIVAIYFTLSIFTLIRLINLCTVHTISNVFSISLP